MSLEYLIALTERSVNKAKETKKIIKKSDNAKTEQAKIAISFCEGVIELGEAMLEELKIYNRKSKNGKI